MQACIEATASRWHETCRAMGCTSLHTTACRSGLRRGRTLCPRQPPPSSQAWPCSELVQELYHLLGEAFASTAATWAAVGMCSTGPLLSHILL